MHPLNEITLNACYLIPSKPIQTIHLPHLLNLFFFITSTNCKQFLQHTGGKVQWKPFKYLVVYTYNEFNEHTNIYCTQAT